MIMIDALGTVTVTARSYVPPGMHRAPRMLILRWLDAVLKLGTIKWFVPHGMLNRFIYRCAKSHGFLGATAKVQLALKRRPAPAEISDMKPAKAPPCPRCNSAFTSASWDAGRKIDNPMRNPAGALAAWVTPGGGLFTASKKSNQAYEALHWRYSCAECQLTWYSDQEVAMRAHFAAPKPSAPPASMVKIESGPVLLSDQFICRKSGAVAEVHNGALSKLPGGRPVIVCRACGLHYAPMNKANVVHERFEVRRAE
jgi:hypothetical protein